MFRLRRPSSGPNRAQMFIKLLVQIGEGTVRKIELLFLLKCIKKFTAHSIARFSLPSRVDTVIKIYHCFSIHLLILDFGVGAASCHQTVRKVQRPTTVIQRKHNIKGWLKHFPSCCDKNPTRLYVKITSSCKSLLCIKCTYKKRGRMHISQSKHNFISSVVFRLLFYITLFFYIYVYLAVTC